MFAVRVCCVVGVWRSSVGRALSLCFSLLLRPLAAVSRSPASTRSGHMAKPVRVYVYYGHVSLCCVLVPRHCSGDGPVRSAPAGPAGRRANQHAAATAATRQPTQHQRHTHAREGRREKDETHEQRTGHPWVRVCVLSGSPSVRLPFLRVPLAAATPAKPTRTPQGHHTQTRTHERTQGTRGSMEKWIVYVSRAVPSLARVLLSACRWRRALAVPQPDASTQRHVTAGDGSSKGRRGLMKTWTWI
jgi:hypothetical protein